MGDNTLILHPHFSKFVHYHTHAGDFFVLTACDIWFAFWVYSNF
jgi:hypothetical protein